MNSYVINEKNYELIKNYKDGFILDEVVNKLTDYFDNYDYIAGDWAYGKLRLKGFYDSDNSKVNSINDIKIFDNYLAEYCARDCKYFLLKKIN
jgi:uncharacterized protein YutD